MIAAYHLSKVYGRGIFALRDLSFNVENGEFVFLTGASGAGKSTLLRLMLRQDLQTEGELIIGGRNVAALRCHEVQAYRRTIGFVFQDFRLLPERTVIDNISTVVRALGTSKMEIKPRAFRVLKRVGLQHRMSAYPGELSGGEQQRVVIARALISDPRLVLADEPTGNLDPDLSLEIMNLLQDVNARGTTVVVATHDRELIRQVGQRTIHLEHGSIVEAE